MNRSLKKILREAPLAWGIIALLDYRSGQKTVRQIRQDFETFKTLNNTTNGKE